MDLFDLSGKTALVTGGTRGIGLMMARGLLQAGARVYISSRKPGACEAAAAELSEFGEVAAIPADLSAEEECLRLAAEVSQREQALAILVNNAGATWGAPFGEFPAAAWDKILDLNLKAPFFLTRALLPLLEAAGTHDDPARVINVGSIDGLHVPSLPVYSYAPSKAGLHHMTRMLAREFGPRHITVNAVAPGPVASDMTRNFPERLRNLIPAGRMGEARDVANACAFLASDEAAFITAEILDVNGGMWGD